MRAERIQVARALRAPSRAAWRRGRSRRPARSARAPARARSARRASNTRLSSGGECRRRRPCARRAVRLAALARFAAASCAQRTGCSPRSTGAAGGGQAQAAVALRVDLAAGPSRPAGGTRPATAARRGRRRRRRCSARRGRTARSRSVSLAAQHVDQVRGAEALAGAVHARQRLLRGYGAVPGLRRLQAVVAVAAVAPGSPRRSSPAAAWRRQRGGLAVAEQRVELAPLQPAPFLAGFGVVDHLAAAAPRRPGRSPSRRRRARRRGRRGRSPGSSPRSTSAGRGARRSARRACRCPCRRRWSRTITTPSSRRKRRWLRGARRRVHAGVVGQGGDALLRAGSSAVSSTFLRDRQ